VSDKSKFTIAGRIAGDKNRHVTIRKSRATDRPRDSASDGELALVTHSSDTLLTSVPLFHLRMASVAYYGGGR
jgi:hypothetical protein